MKAGDKVLMLTSWYPHQDHPLDGIFVQEYASLLSQYYEILVIHPIFKEHLGVPFRLLPSSSPSLPKAYTLYIHYKRGMSAFFSNRRNYHRAIRHAIKELVIPFAPQLLHSQVIWQGGLAAKMIQRELHLPWAHLEHYSGFLPADGALKGYRLLLAKKWLRNAHSHAAVSQALVERITPWVHKPIQTIFNVLDPLFFSAEIVPPLSQEPFHFIHISSLDERMKQTSQIIRTFKQFHALHPQSKLTVVGPVARHSPLIPLMDASIELLPSGMPKKELLQLMQSAHVNICFSLYETFAVTVAESLCLGIPNIYTACGGPEYYISENMGWKCDSKSTVSLLNAMQQAWNDYPHISKKDIAQQARKTLSREDILQRFHQLFDLACAELPA